MSMKSELKDSEEESSFAFSRMEGASIEGQRAILKVGDIIAYIPKGAPKMDNSHLIPIKCEILDIDDLFYKLSNGMAYPYKRFHELVQSVNGVIY